jgi:hypothetical protein
MIVYLSGSITKDPNYRSKFADAEKTLRKMGHVVLNPCCLPVDLDYNACMEVDFAMIKVADAICLLNDWHVSKGAVMEYYRAFELGKTVLSFDEYVEENLANSNNA